MATLYYCPAIDFGGAELYWLPVPLLTRSLGEDKETVRFEIPLGKVVVKRCKTRGYMIGVSGWINKLTTAEAQAEQRNLREAIQGQGDKGQFDLWFFNDECFKGCHSEGGVSFEESPRPSTLIAYSFDAYCADGISRAAGDIINFADYDNEYPYADRVGRPTGTTEPGGGPTLAKVRPIISLKFDGAAVVSSSGEEKIVPFPTVADDCKVIGVAISHSFIDPTKSSGQTTIRIANYAIGGSGESIDISLPYNEITKSLVSGTINISPAAGDKVYAWITATAGHVDIEFQIHIEV